MKRGRKATGLISFLKEMAGLPYYFIVLQCEILSSFSPYSFHLFYTDSRVASSKIHIQGLNIKFRHAVLQEGFIQKQG